MINHMHYTHIQMIKLPIPIILLYYIWQIFGPVLQSWISAQS